MKSNSVSIIGAGPAGLTAAYFLKDKNIVPIIYEGSKEIGGLAGSITLWNKSYDIGPHIFLESSQSEAVNFWKKIGGNDLIRMTLSRGMILNKKLILFPPTPVGLLNALGFISFCIAGISAAQARLFGNTDFKNAGTFFQKRYGNYFRSRVFNPFCEKYMGISDSLVNLNFATSLTSFVKESGKTDVVTDENVLKSLIYPKQGTKVIWKRIAEEVQKKGEILFEKKLVKIITKENRIERLCFSDGTETQTEYLISSLPIVVLLQLMDNTPTDILEQTKKLEYRNTVLVYLKIAGKAFDHHYVTAFDHSVEAGRITNFNSWKKDGNENEDTVLCIEYWCNSNDTNWTCTKEEIISKATSELEKVKLISPNKVKGAEVLKLPRSHPVLSIEHNDALSIINNYLLKFKNLSLAGRHATFKWDGQADNISAGMKLAEKIETFLKEL